MRLVLLLTTLVVASGCDTTRSSDSYSVAFLDTAGAEVSRATLAFERPVPEVGFAGTYRHVSGRRLATSEELQVLGLTDGTLQISLDSQVADGGVELVGPFSGGTSEGTWTVGSFAGPVPGGTFRAERR